MEQQSYSTEGIPSLKRLGLHIQHPTCQPHLENEEENAKAKISREKNPKQGFKAFQKAFHYSPGM